MALTRTKAVLELHVVKNRPPSIFMEGLNDLRTAAQAAGEAFSRPLEQWGADEAVAVADVYRYLHRYVEVWSGIGPAERQHVARWVVTANNAWGLKSTPPLPRDLEQQLMQVAAPDEAEIEACVQKLGVRHRYVKHGSCNAEDGQRRAYDFVRDGRLGRGTTVWHKLHGRGKVTYSGVETAGEVVEVAFDRGRTTKFVVERASFEILP